MPASFAIHAAGIAALVAAAAIAPVELPVPPSPPLLGPVVEIGPRPPSGGRRTAAVPERRRERRPAPADQAPLVEPVTPPPPEPFDPAPAGPECFDCLPDDGPPGIGDDGPDGGDGPGGDGRSGTAPGPVRVGGKIEPPQKVRHVDPIYPELAQRAGVTGIVILECVIDRDGRVDRVVVLRGHPLLDGAAVGAVRQWRYRPTLLNGVPVEVVMTVTVRFAAAR
jgi:protein TonB